MLQLSIVHMKQDAFSASQNSPTKHASKDTYIVFLPLKAVFVSAAGDRGRAVPEEVSVVRGLSVLHGVLLAGCVLFHIVEDQHPVCGGQAWYWSLDLCFSVLC